MSPHNFLFPIPECQNYLADLVFVVDLSQDLGEGEYNQLVNFLSTFVNRINSGQNGVRVGAIRYGRNPEDV